MTDGPEIRRVLQIHTRYRQAGGEDRAVEAERQLLEDAGTSVDQLIFDNADLDDSRGIIGDFALAVSAVWSRSAARRVAYSIRAARPDVVHVHNTFAAASPSVFRAASALGVPVVQTLHNYRMVCPAATLFRDGRVCTDCLNTVVPAPAVVHACVRGSRSQSVIAASTLSVHRAIGTFSKHVRRFIALTEFQRATLVRGGLPADRIAVVPNFLEPGPVVGTTSRRGILFVGRLSIEKGIETLLRAAAEVPGVVRIVGDGPLAPLVVAAAARGDVDYLGRLDGEGVTRELQSAGALVIPSVWFEGFPMVVLEAYATGTPVIATEIGSLAEVVRPGRTGLHVNAGDVEGFSAAFRQVLDDPSGMMAMGAGARATYEDRYRGPGHLRALLDVYAAAAAR